MLTVSAQLLTVLRTSHVRLAKAVHKNLVTDVETTLPIEDGSVTVDANSSIRRTLNLSISPRQALWDALDTPGGEITVTFDYRFVNGTHEFIPGGVFVVDQEALGYSQSGQIAMTCPDRWVKVQRDKMLPGARASVATNAAWQEIKRLVEGCYTTDYPFPGWAVLDTTATTKVGAQLWDDGDRDAAINGTTGIAPANSLEVFFDATGMGVLRPVPVLSDVSPSVWQVDAGQRGVMVDSRRTRDRTRVRNSIAVSTSATDVQPFTPVVVENTTMGDPYSVDGPLGRVVYDYSSPLLRNSTQAHAAGLTILSRQLGVAQQIEIETTGNPALDAHDVIDVVFPKTELSLPRPIELHIIDSVTHPLLPDGTQTIQTRSTRPDTDGA